MENSAIELNRHLRTVHNIFPNTEDFYDYFREHYYPTFGIKTGYCEICGKPTKFLKLCKGFAKTCSTECKHKQASKTGRSTNLERYGVEWNSQLQSVKDSKIQTSREKYGTNHPMQTKEVRENFKKSMKEKYGYEYSSYVPEIKEKAKQTNLEKYGVENPFQSREIKEKIKKINLERYGVENPRQNKDICRKGVISFLRRRLEVFDEFKDNLIKKEIVPLFSKEDFANIDNVQFSYKCLRCDIDFQTSETVTPKIRCPHCINTFRSQFENEISLFISTLISTEVIRNSRTVIPPYELDIYVPEHKLAIEANGIFWHSDYHLKNNRYHSLKTRACDDNNIRLIHITDNDWREKQEICKSIIKSALGQTTKIYARQCKIQKIDNTLYRNFCETNHIQGYSHATTRLGLFQGDKLVQICSFGGSRFRYGEIELIRSCSLLGTTVVGGLSKLVSFFVKEYAITNLVTYCDKHYFTGQGYTNSGWKLISETPPNYWYFKPTDCILHSRLQFQKHKLSKILENFDPTLTETQNMKNNGWYRYFDCGSLKLVYQK